MKAAEPLSEHAELLILPDGRILAHNITPEIAAILAELDPKDELIARRAVQNRSPDGLKGQFKSAQGSALGCGEVKNESPEGAH